MLGAGADVNARAQAAAPIHGAVMGGSAEMIRLLLEKGADPNAPDFEGRSARQLAEKMGRPELAVLFG